MSTPRANKAVEKLCIQLNDTQTTYPKTCLKLIFKTVSNDFAIGHESCVYNREEKYNGYNEFLELPEKPINLKV